MSLRVLMWISAVSVCIGFIVGLVVIQPPHDVHSPSSGGEGGDEKQVDAAVNPMNRSVANSFVTEADTTDSTPPSSPTKLIPQQAHSANPHTAHTTTSTPTTSVPAPTLITPLTFADKLRLFKEQLLFLRMAFKSRTLTALLLYWVVGNAVFQVVYLCCVVMCCNFCHVCTFTLNMRAASLSLDP